MSGIEHLNDRRCRTAKPPAGKTVDMLCDGKGLYLRVSIRKDEDASDDGKEAVIRKSWVLRYRLNGQTHDMGLGSFDKVTLAKARELARKYRALVRAGIDPIEAFKAEKATNEAKNQLAKQTAKTFDECVMAYIAEHEAGWSSAKHVEQWRSSPRVYASPALGKLPMSAIDTAAVMRVLSPIWKTKPETASRLRQRIERVWGWAATNGVKRSIGGKAAASDRLFPEMESGRKGRRAGDAMYDQRPLRLIRDLGYANKMSVHGCRSALKSWLVEASNFPWEISKLALGHKLGGETDAAYLRGDALAKRFKAAEAWANFLAKPVDGTASNVITMGKRALA